MTKVLVCESCGAKVRNISKERGRFKRRHPKLCKARAEKMAYTKQLAQTYRSVIADKPEDRDPV